MYYDIEIYVVDWTLIFKHSVHQLITFGSERLYKRNQNDHKEVDVTANAYIL